MAETEFERLSREEVTRRVEYLEQHQDLEHGDFGRADWIAAILVMAGSLVMLVWGAFL